MSTKKEYLNEYIGNVNHVNKDIRNSLKRIIQQIEMSDYQCVAGYLRNNTAFVALKEISELKPTNREGKVPIKVRINGKIEDYESLQDFCHYYNLSENSMHVWRKRNPKKKKRIMRVLRAEIYFDGSEDEI